MKSWRVACIQMAASEDPEDNLRRATVWARKAIRQKARFLTFPENFIFRGKAGDLKVVASKTPAIVRHFQALARETKTAILLGSLFEPSGIREKFYNTSFLISESGRLAGKYRKIHLFKVGLKQVRTDESRHIQAGSKLGIGKVSGVLVGMTICYDLRFPELFRRLTFAGAQVITVPANFTNYTGQAHWEVLLRARAIENQIFIVAPAQVGISASSGILSFGASLIIDPWGKVLARGSCTAEQWVIADLDFSFQRGLRAKFPVLKHT